MPEMYLKQPGLTYSACGLFTKNKERIQQFKQTGDSRYIYQNNQIKFVFNMSWLNEILKIWLEEELLIKYYVMKHLIFLKIQKMIDIKEVLLQWFINSLIKNLLAAVLKMRKFQTKSQLKNNKNQLLENLIKTKYIHLLQIIFGVLILLISNQKANLIKEFRS